MYLITDSGSQDEDVAVAGPPSVGFQPDEPVSSVKALAAPAVRRLAMENNVRNLWIPFLLS